MVDHVVQDRRPDRDVPGHLEQDLIPGPHGPDRVHELVVATREQVGRNFGLLLETVCIITLIEL